jgi:hypothetical protein
MADAGGTFAKSMRRVAFVALLAALAVVVSASATAAPGGNRLGEVTLDGVGGVTPGMTAEEVATTWGIPVRVLSTLCAVVKVNPGGARGSAIFVDGKLKAVFFQKGVRTTSGIGIGSTITGLQRIYGRRLQSATGSHFFFLTRHDQPRWQIRFDTNRANRVIQIGFGDSVSVHVVAGCA